MTFYIKDNHHLLTSSSEIQEICAPLLENSCINYIAYNYHDFQTGTYYGLNNLGVLEKNWLEKSLYPTANELKTIQHMSYGFLSPELELPPGFDRKKFCDDLELCNDFGVTHRLCFTNIQENYAEYYVFGTPALMKSAIPFFINNIDIFQKFVSYFQSSTQKLLAEAKKNTLLLPNFLDKSHLSTEAKDSAHLDRKQLLNIFNTFKKISSAKYNAYNLTQREIQILAKIAEGWTYKEIAYHFNISQRTVETHVENIKQKTSVSYKTQLRELGKRNWEDESNL